MPEVNENEEVTVRSIYSKAIYARDSQMDRKVYQRANNVLPVNEPNSEDDDTEPVVVNPDNTEPTEPTDNQGGENTEPTEPSEPTDNPTTEPGE